MPFIKLFHILGGNFHQRMPFIPLKNTMHNIIFEICPFIPFLIMKIINYLVYFKK